MGPIIVQALQFTAIVVGIIITIFVLLLHFKPGLVYKLYTRTLLYNAGLSVKYVKAGEYTYCYAEKDAGNSNKPTLLFLHGFSTSKDMWAGMVKRMPNDVHTVVVDMPGHGDTTLKIKTDHSFVAQAKKIHQFVEACGLNRKPFHVIGASMGGAVAGTYASLYPRDLAKLTLVCPAGLLTPRHSDFYESVKDGKSNVLISSTAEELKMTLRACLYKELKLPNWVFNMVVQAKKPRLEFYRHLMTELTEDKDGLETRLSKIKTPTQVIWGQNDQIIDVSGVDILKKDLKTLKRVDILQECGHTIPLDKPGEAVEVLRKFMNY